MYTPIKWIRLTILPMIFLVSAAFYWPYQPKEEIPNPWDNIPMCAPLQSLEMDFGDANRPMAPLLNTNWDHSFQVTTSSEEAQRFFDQGLFFMYGFNHAEAERAFREAVRLDPECAMAHWGVALSLGPNINRPMIEEAFEDAYNFSQKAKELSKNGTAKEQALIKALSIRYVENPPQDRSPLDLKYANAMRVVAHRYREDLDILSLFAESLMDTTPWDYWKSPDEPKDVIKEVHAALEYIISKEPNHPGGNHFYIHSVEEFQPGLAEKSADALTESGYLSGHLVHMPSHIYVRLGRYEDSNTANIGGIDLDEDYITQCQAQGYYPALYYPHNVHFLWFGATMNGQSKIALEAARKTAEKGEIPRFKAIPIYSLLRFGEWEVLLEEPQPDTEHPYGEILWHFARGMAHAKLGAIEDAKKELALVKKLFNDKEVQEEPGALKGMSEICYLMLTGEIAGQNQSYLAKIALLQKAVEIQDAFQYTEPPYFYLPMRQALGAALIEAGQAVEAEAVFREELKKFPDNIWSLYGLYQSQKAQGKEEAAKETKAAFDKAAAKADVKISAAVM